MHILHLALKIKKLQHLWHNELTDLYMKHMHKLQLTDLNLTVHVLHDYNYVIILILLLYSFGL